MNQIFVLLTLGILALAGCSDDTSTTNNANNNGTTSTNNGTNSTNNGTNSTNNGTNSTNNNTSDTCDTNGFTLVDAQLYLETPDITLTALSSTTAPNDSFNLEFYGADSPIEKGPGTYLLGGTAADQNYETCNNCLLLKQNCGANTGCETIYFAKSGEVVVDVITLAPGLFTGKLVNVVLEEVEVGTETFATTPVPNGKTWCIAETPFNVAAE